MSLFIEIATVLVFILSSGILFRQKWSENPWAVGAAAFVSAGSSYFMFEELTDRAIKQFDAMTLAFAVATVSLLAAFSGLVSVSLRSRSILLKTEADGDSFRSRLARDFRMSCLSFFMGVISLATAGYAALEHISTADAAGTAARQETEVTRRQVSDYQEKLRQEQQLTSDQKTQVEKLTRQVAELQGLVDQIDASSKGQVNNINHALIECKTKLDSVPAILNQERTKSEQQLADQKTAWEKEMATCGGTITTLKGQLSEANQRIEQLQASLKREQEEPIKNPIVSELESCAASIFSNHLALSASLCLIFDKKYTISAKRPNILGWQVGGCTMYLQDTHGRAVNSWTFEPGVSQVVTIDKYRVNLMYAPQEYENNECDFQEVRN